MVLDEKQNQSTGVENVPLYAPPAPYPQQYGPATGYPPQMAPSPPIYSSYPPPPSQGYAAAPGYAPPPQPYPSAYQSAPLPPQKEVYIGEYPSVTTAYVSVNISDSSPSIVFPWYSSTQRNTYIAKVLLLLFFQLAVTTGVCLLVWFVFPDLKLPWWGLLILIFGTLTLIFVMQAVRKMTPLNYILLFVFTIGISVLVALTVVTYSVLSVLNALFVTLTVTIGIIFYVVVTKEDYTVNAMSLVIMALWGIFWWAMFSFVFFAIFWTRLSTYGIIFSLFGILLFTGLLLFDISRIVHRDFDITEDHAVIQGAIALYLDIINLFLCFLSLFGNRK